MDQTIEEKIMYLVRVFEEVAPLKKSGEAMAVLKTTVATLGLRSDFSVIKEEYEKFLKMGPSKKT